MKIKKKQLEGINLEPAHGGSGSRRVLAGEDEVMNYQGVTYGYLPTGNKYEWHKHDDVNEIMFVMQGTGTVRDDDGIYAYEPGDFFIYPVGIYHEIENTGKRESEFLFVRVYDKKLNM